MISSPARSAWRIVKARHAKTALDGEGARLYGGRWNSPGVPIVYLAESRALALLEILVHLGHESALAGWVLIEVALPKSVPALDAGELGRGWRASPAPRALAERGDAWARAHSSAFLAVPSAIVPEERLYLLNPRHPDASRVRAQKPVPVAIDARLGAKEPRKTRGAR